MSAREEILGRIRAASAGATPRDEIPRGYRRRWDAPVAEHLDRLTTRLRDYGVDVLRAAAEAEIAGLVTRRLAERGVDSLLVPPDLPRAWRPETGALVEDAGQTASELDRIDGVMTGCAIAVAETGTIILDAGVAQGRRAVTLVPDYYCCVVFARQVVGIMPEAISALAGAAQLGRPITFISGPSATADIELDRVAGVHGPRILDVVLVG